MKSETYFSRETIENLRAKMLKENSIVGRGWSSVKLFIVQNYTENTNGDVPFKRKIHYPFKWIRLNGNVKIGWCILKNLTIFNSSI